MNNKNICLIEFNSKNYWAIYHSDDGGSKLVFTANKNDLKKIETFSKSSLEEIVEHMNFYGFDVEPEEQFGDIIYFKNIPKEMKVQLVDFNQLKL